VPFGPKNFEIFRAQPTNSPSNDVARLKSIKYKCHINNRCIVNFMYTSVVALLCVVVCRYVGILAAVLCVLCGGGGGLPGMDPGGGGGGGQSYITFDPSLTVS
jgi:hypothetical protein